jgi:hypothetical protein
MLVDAVCHVDRSSDLLIVTGVPGSTNYFVVMPYLSISCEFPELGALVCARVGAKRGRLALMSW